MFSSNFPPVYSKLGSSTSQLYKIKMTVTYSMDKYREAKDYSSTVKVVEGYQAYVNNPLNNTFISIQTMDGKYLLISRELILTIEMSQLPKWALMTEKQIVSSAEQRHDEIDSQIKFHETNQSNGDEIQ